MSCCNSCADSGGSCAVTKAEDVGVQPTDFSGYIDLDDREVQFKAVRKNFRPVRKIDFQGLDISIEHDKGMSREWKDRDGSVGKTKMMYPYGYICRTDGADGEQVDVYVGPNAKSDKVFIVHQMAVPDFKKYDEDKVMVGFDSAREAKAAYLMHYDNPKFFGTMTSTTVDDFKRMFVKKSMSGDVKNPGSRGGDWYRTESGKVRYGKRPGDQKAVGDLAAGIKSGDMAKVKQALVELLPEGFNIRHPDAKIVTEEDMGVKDGGFGTMAELDVTTGTITLSSRIEGHLKTFAEDYARDPDGYAGKVKEILATAESEGRGEAIMRHGDDAMATLRGFGAVRTLIHEIIHDGGPVLNRDTYRGSGEVLEEVATEITARARMREIFGVDLMFNGEDVDLEELVSYGDFVSDMTAALSRVMDVTPSEAVKTLENASFAYKRQTGKLTKLSDVGAVFSEALGDQAETFRTMLKYTPIGQGTGKVFINEDEWSQANKSLTGGLTDGVNKAQLISDYTALRKALSGAKDENLQKGLTERLQKMWRKIKAAFSQDQTKPTKTWVRNSAEECRTGICIDLNGQTIPIDETFSGIDGYELDGPPAHTHCKCGLYFNQEKSFKSFNGETQPQPVGQPSVVPGGMAVPQLMVDPHDVETFEGVESLLGRIGSAKEPELMEIASKIWGKGYNYEGMPADQARSEILGWLLDQRDLLGIAPDESAAMAPSGFQPSPSLPTQDPNGSSEYSGAYITPEQSHAVGSTGAGSADVMLSGSNTQGSSDEWENRPQGTR